MKKAIVIIIAVAILGGAGFYHKSHDSDNQTTFQGFSSKAQASPVTNTTPSPTPSSSSTASSSTSSGYKDGTYTGAAEDTPYGTVQVAAVISGGKIIDIKFLQMPGPEGHSKQITAFAESPLKQTALAKQSAKIDFVSGATSTSEGYEQSLQAALDQAA